MERLLIALLLFAPISCTAADFSGKWKIDLRNATQRAQKVECDFASFELLESSDRIRGKYYAATPNCSRLDEGGEVRGIKVSSNEAVLVVLSARDGMSVVIGKALIDARRNLHWSATDDLVEGGDNLIIRSAVMLHKK